jgi:hypothetical protein
MTQKRSALWLAGLVWIMASCAKKPAAQYAQMNAMVTPEGHFGSSLESEMAVAQAAPVGRFVAERHKLEVATTEGGLQKSWEAAVSFCGTIGCEVVSSSIITKNGTLDPSGAMTLRVVPEDLQKLFTQLESLGQITTHTTEREDKTTAVIDTEARLKNLTAFRDNLRGMLSKPSATVKDLVEIQQQLTETQSQLDSESAQRKFLANETEKVRVEIAFRVARAGEKGGAFSEIRDALRDSGSVLADSTASLITVIVAVIPWLVFIIPGVWFFVRLWRKWRSRRKRVNRPSAAVPPEGA